METKTETVDKKATWLQGGWSLPKTFWLTYFVPSVAVQPVMWAIVGLSPAAGVIVSLGWVAYMVVVLIAVWRCAVRVKGGWAVAAQVCVLLAALGSVWYVLGALYLLSES